MPSFLANSRKRSKKPGKNRLGAVGVSLEASQVWDVAQSLGEPDFVFDDPIADRTVVAFGRVRRFTARSTSKAPFEIAERAREELGRIQHVAGLDEVAPVAVGGFAFDPLRTGQGNWADFPAGVLELPSLTLIREGESAWAIQIAPLARRPSAEKLSRRLSRESTQPRGNSAESKATPRKVALKLLAEGDALRRWRHAVDALLSRMADAELEKAVLARSLSVARPAAVDALGLVQRLRSMQPSSVRYLVRRGEASFLGATPEILFRREGARLESVALAGSAPRNDDPEFDRSLARSLMSSPKERREHALVVEAITDALEPLVRSLEVPQSPRIRRLKQVQHLETPIAANLNDEVSEAALLSALHPTPAVCGQPRSHARELLRALESFDRGWYAGPVGWLTAEGKSAFAVAIRSMLLCKREAHLFVGAGIVPGSNADAEWRETELKSQAMLRALGGSP